MVTPSSPRSIRQHVLQWIRRFLVAINAIRRGQLAVRAGTGRQVVAEKPVVEVVPAGLVSAREC